ncbi:MAG: excinuclease ABC subunit UvrC [Proteobacteria bacterium]|nr:excinuclease ABC subunit UvrC [Pseudomonadota bacterium]MDE3208338.1 excinuclease ABC subunit UvrC [Pseudomonadota bacterium]
MFDYKSYLLQLTSLPGVYRMFNDKEEVIYVGKAKNLKKRVSSYFKNSNLSPRTQLMVSHIHQIEVTVTRSESEALLLENNLIKSLNPRFNILFRDDKSYPYIILSGHQFPKLGLFRGNQERQGHYYGPFPNAGAVRESIHLLQKIFQLRTCEDSVFNNRSRPCMLYQIKRCSAPCTGLIDTVSYAETIKHAELFLSGKHNEVIELLEKKMHIAAQQQLFERAAHLRDQIFSLRKVQEKQFVSSGQDQDVDVIAASSSSEKYCLNLVMIRGGRHLGDQCFFPRHASEAIDTSIIETFMAQHYLSKPIPGLILVNQAFDVNPLEEVLSLKAGYSVRIISKTRGEKQVWLDMAQKNADLALIHHHTQISSQKERLASLQSALGLPSDTHRIECFDISHMMGEATIGSCVVYDKLTMQPSQYRRFNITGITPGDDFAAMNNILSRRYRKVALGEQLGPDLILIDGGRGQVNIAVELLKEYGLEHIPVIGVSKGPERKAGYEQLIFADRKNPLQLEKNHPGLFLIQTIRDEAHRFAITGHRSKRGKSRTHSVLENITGIGAKRRQKLLSTFGGIRGVEAASIDDLMHIAGISKLLAETIYKELH